MLLELLERLLGILTNWLVAGRLICGLCLPRKHEHSGPKPQPEGCCNVLVLWLADGATQFHRLPPPPL